MNRREWKKSRLTERQLKNRKIISIIGIAAGVTVIIAAIFVCLGVFGVIRIPGSNGDKDQTAAVDAIEVETIEAEAGAETENGTDTMAENGNDAESENDEDSDSDSEDDAEDDGSFDREKWLASPPVVKGLYVTGPVAGSSRFDEILSIIDSTEINAVVLDVKNDEGNVTFKMSSGHPSDIGACVGYIRDIDATLQELKDRDVYVIGRIACFKDPVLAEADADCALKTSDGRAVTDGEGLAWVNPCNETTWEYLIGIAEYCADIGFDEIQYDYVRFPVGDVAAQADYGVELGDTDKHEYIEGFLQLASERIHAKGIPVTADVFGTVIGNEVDVGMVGQDYVKLAECVDALCPMVYPSHYGNGVYGIPVPDARPYDTVYAALTSSSEELSSVDISDRAIVRPWLQAFTATWVPGHISYDEEQIQDQIRAVEDAGYESWILWNAKNNYTALK
ncbi:MAG: putative glycoside hydrolase [Lachnospiraceae bacterium]|nr:putative glycoside hydrolase [Lachnospiraceae bacterium]